MRKRVKSNYSLAWWAAGLLGAVDGLLIGLIAEGLRLKYEAHQIEVLLREAEQRNLKIGYLLTPAMNLQLPIICILGFTLISPLVFRYLIKRPSVLRSLWLGLGATAAVLGYLMATAYLDLLSLLWSFAIVAITYIVYWCWRSSPDSLPLLWAINGISVLIVIALCVQLVGLFFPWPELRSPFVWLSLLVANIAINAVFGAVIGIIDIRLNARRLKASNG